MPYLNIDKVARAVEAFGYADARVLSTKTTSISIKDGVVESLAENSSEGVSARVYGNGTFGFACANGITRFPAVLKRASKLARLGRGDTRIREPELNKKTIELKPVKDPADFSVEEKIALLLDVEKSARVPKEVHSVQVSYRDSFIEKLFVNSVGSEVVVREPRVACYVTVYARRNNDIQWSFERVLRRSGLEALKGFEAKAESAAEVAASLLFAKKAPSGKNTVVLDPRMSGILAHEAVGHASEADLVSSGSSCFEGKLGETVAGEDVTIIDSPLVEKGLWGSYAYDDEGTRAKGTRVIERGVLKNYLTSVDSARFTGVLTGNARVDWLNTPLVRMSNTYFAPGKESKDGVFDVKRGVYVLDSRGGQVSTKQGLFMFSAGYGYAIRNDEVREEEMLRDFAISGNIFEALKNVEAVGKDLRFNPGFCGKSGQDVPVTDGAPHLRIGKVLVG
jgi:TldD protein